MKSLKELYKIGRGPSSSHTIGPEKAAKLFMQKTQNATEYKVVLYDSLAKTGKGHGTDRVLKKTFDKPCTVVFCDEEQNFRHPNAMDMYALKKDGETLSYWRVYSVGGGAIEIDG